ncbi:MAG TPA: hypothetical protein VF171_05705 [Trueperaceae bacterium]
MFPRTYVSFYHEDYDEVAAFLEEFDHLDDQAFYRPLGERLPEDIVKGTNKLQVIHKMRERFLKDSTVTLLLLGPCTFAQRAVDLELLASLHHGGDEMATPDERRLLPNGLLAIMLRSYQGQGFPDRLDANLRVPPESRTEPYAIVRPYPEDKDALAGWLAEAEQARTERLDLVANTPQMFDEDRPCPDEYGQGAAAAR